MDRRARAAAVWARQRWLWGELRDEAVWAALILGAHLQARSLARRDARVAAARVGVRLPFRAARRTPAVRTQNP
jgi:hypothetical protein